MPATCKRIDGVWRLVEPDGRIIRTSKGTPADGGGHDTQGGCMAQARALNSSMQLSSMVYIPPHTSEWLLSEEESQTYRKELIYAGQFRQSDGVEFTVDEALLSHWQSTFETMQANGVKVPMPLKHTDDPEAKRGDIVGMEVGPNAEGVPALFAFAKFRDADAAQLAKTTDVSLFSPPEFIDGKGNRYVRPIRHVALTDYPIVPGLDGFEAISASFINPGTGEPDMPLTNLLKRLNIECEAEDQAEDAIVASFESMQGTIAEKDTAMKSKDDEIATLKSKLPADPVTVTASHRTMLRDNRTMKLDKLVGEQISPAVRDGLVELFCSDDSLNLVLSHENGDDKFDRVLEILAKNEVVQLSENGTAPPQGGVVVDKNDGKVNPLLADAKQRADAAK